MMIGESLNVTFDESFLEPKSSSSIKYDRIDEPIVQDLNGSSLLQVIVSDEGYHKSLKEARGHPIEQVTGELNERILREVRMWDKIWNPLSPNHIVHGYSIKDLSEENRNMLSSINEAIKPMLAITTNMSRIIKNITEKQESKDYIIVAKNTFKGNALDPWIHALEQGGATI
uniref:Uncharacterized protein n=1 Tax=Tanacetum cinerariifolium TaxID=118510 RepID=A0A699H1M9_TANCI|nr:hypothetical protein [Tanacetum cinerariifolium]